MAKDNRSSVAVGRDTAAALKGIADAVGATVGDLLRLAALKPTAIQRAYLEGLRAEAYARLVKLDRRAASGSSAASAEPRPSAAAASGSSAASAEPRPSAAAASSGSGSGSGSPASARQPSGGEPGGSALDVDAARQGGQTAARLASVAAAGRGRDGDGGRGEVAGHAPPRERRGGGSGLRLGWRYITACNSPVGTRERRGGGSWRWRRRSRSAAEVRRRREARGQFVRGTE